MTIHGAKKGSSKQRQPIIAPDSAQSKTYINSLYGLGEGEIAGLANGYKSVYLDDTPLQNDDGEFNFTDVKVDFRAGTNDQTYIDGFADVASETNVGVELKHGTPWVKSFNNLDLDALRVRLKWGALRSQNRENGDVSGVKIDYAIDIKTDGGGWVQALTTAINAKTSNAYERSHRIDLPKAQTGWAVRVRRITPNSTSELVSDKMFVSAITEVIDLKLRYPNTALLGLRYDAEQFSNVAKMAARCRGLIIKVPTNYNPITRTYDGLWDGEFKMAYSNNPAWVYYDLCTAERYGLGSRLTQSMIDKWSLYRLAQYCDQMVDDGMGGQEPRFTVNVYIQSADGAFELLSRLAGVFRAISYWDGTSIVLDADIPQDSIYSFSRANVIDGIFEYTGTRARDRHTVAKVAWDNPANHFKTEYEYVRDEKAIAKFGVRVADIQAWGCTSKGQAQRAGIWALKSEQLETRMVTFKVGLDGLIPAPAKVIEISDELFAGRATGGRVLAINKTKTVITLDRAITAKAGDTLVINGDDGTSQRRQISVVNGDNVTVTKPFGDISEQNVWVLDSQDLATMRFRVLSVTADDNHQFTITAVQYSPAKYDAIDTGAAAPERPISVINPTVQAPTKSVNLSSYHTVNQGVSITTLVIGWEQVSGAVKYAVQWRKDNGNWQTLPPTGTNSIEVTGVYAGQYEARVTAISAFGQASLATHSNLTQIQGKQGKPPRPINLSVQGVLFGMNLGWNFAKGSDDTNFTEIQVSPDGRTHITTLGTFAYPTNKHEITGLQGNLTQFYRARIVDKLGNTSDWTDWVSGMTSADADKVLDILSGQISQSHLDQSLQAPIAKIGTIESRVGAVVGNVSALSTDMVGVKNTLNTAKDALNTAINNIGKEKNRINTAIFDINALQSANNAKTQEIANLTQTVNGHTSSIRDLGVTTGDLSQKYSQLKTTSDTANSEITAIKQTQSTQATSVERLGARFDSLSVGGRNLILNSGVGVQNDSYPISSYPLAPNHGLAHGDDVVITIWGQLADSKTAFYAYNSDGWVKLGGLSKISDGVYVLKTKWTITSGTKTASNTALNIYPFTKAQAGESRIDKIKLERGNIATDWTPAPEDLQVDLSPYATSANLDEFKQAQADKDTANAQKLSQISANVATIENTANDALSRAKTANSTISTEQKARVDADNSLASRISTLDSAYKTADNQLSTRISTAEQTATDAKTALATAQSQLNARFDSLSVGGRNLILNSGVGVQNDSYPISSYPLAPNHGLAHGDDVVITIWGQLADSKTAFYAYNSDGWVKLGGLSKISDGVYVLKTKWTITSGTKTASNTALNIYPFTKAQAGESRIDKIKLERGNIATDWTPAPEDLQVDLSPYATSANLDEFKQTVAEKDSSTAQKLSKLQSDIGTKANATALNSLTARVNQTDGKITTQTQRINTLQTTVSGNTSSINTLSQSLTTKERALTEQINTAKSELGGRITQISNETRTLSNANRTIGERINTVQTTVNSQTASIEQHAQSLNGLSAQWTLKVQSGGVVSGIGLASNNGVSDFAVRADKFYITSPTGGNKSPMFTVTTRPTTLNGTTIPAGVYLSDAYIQNASITMAKIADSIQSDNYVAGRQGWRLFKDGRFELNNTFGDGSSLELNSKGLTVWYDKAQGKKAVELGILL